VASAIASTSRQIGATFGVAVVGALVTSSLGVTTHVGSASAIHAGWWVLAGCGVVVLMLGEVVSTGWAKQTADQTARDLNPEFLERPA
jgi:hypothetical protein